MIVQFLVATNRHIWYAQLEVIGRPILELRPTFRPFVADEKVRKQHTRRVRRNEDQNVPESVQVGKVQPRPRIAEHSIVDPAHDGHYQNGGIADAQSVDPFVMDATDGGKVK